MTSGCVALRDRPSIPAGGPNARPAGWTTSDTASLGGLPLADLGIDPAAEPEPAELDERELVDAVLRATGPVVARLAESASRAAFDPTEGRVDPAAALHHLVTRNRFIKGSRSLLPFPLARPVIERFTGRGEPVHLLLRGFPFKQRDNRLKAVGPLPDLAELGALLRLRELRAAFAAVYRPGLRFTVMADGGYYRPRSCADLVTYRRTLVHFARLTGVDDVLEVTDQAQLLAGVMGERRWRERERLLAETTATVAAVVRPAWERGLTRETVAEATVALAAGGLELPAGGGPSFAEVFRSLLYSVPVPATGGHDGPRWSAVVLADVFDLDADADLRCARRRVLEHTWHDSVGYLATALVDHRLRVLDALPPHLRLVTGAPRAGAYGFTYLGGSTLLPWHGTGCVDQRGRIGVDFHAALRERGFVAVHRPGRSGDDGRQPLCMVPPDAIEHRSGRRIVSARFLDAIRLRSR